MLQGKVALITGAATGIGRATALRLAKEGVHITINYSKSEQEARETQKEVEALGVKSLLYKADVADDEAVRLMVKETIQAFGRLDILINNAGITNFVDHRDLEGLKDEYWDRAMDVNVKGVFHCCRATADELRKQQGCIINITSIAGMTGLGSSIAYAASKAAAISVTKSLARVMAPEVRVNCVSPGVVQTRWVEGQDEHVQRLAAGTPMGRVASPEDVSEVIYSLLAHSRFVTGQNVVVDGGMFI
ncbi:3-ketoacyl-ACP reductase [Brevibacillus reuszeri]|uniref:3-ketoacyl-ACP reductase n=1 Tax=Brevibacillus reuszeri TaxID=54915 RepID=A0A0K9YJH2_9BACL|nr:glucose 1-dehydrogenase [Brevibacillus reuszeri]KNB68824.1 3-ketoacyl-ACP reductase [Brevibacillus reuszeri]MED1859131.1 glucose 1-dehydrogenase [Brevibacillus reuszeri]GED69350.1 3-ketoacyl-ACP reductase [Brevibacillus reuszeri]